MATGASSRSSTRSSRLHHSRFLTHHRPSAPRLSQAQRTRPPRTSTSRRWRRMRRSGASAGARAGGISPLGATSAESGSGSGRECRNRIQAVPESRDRFHWASLTVAETTQIACSKRSCTRPRTRAPSSRSHGRKAASRPSWAAWGSSRPPAETPRSSSGSCPSLTSHRPIP